MKLKLIVFTFFFILPNHFVFALNNSRLVKNGEFGAVLELDIQKAHGPVNCTGSLISSNTILTAAHCLIEIIDCKKHLIKPKNISININGTQTAISSFHYNEDFLDPMITDQSTGKCKYPINSRYDMAYLIIDGETHLKPMKVSFTPKKKLDFKETKSLGFGMSYYKEIERLSRAWFYNYAQLPNYSGLKQIGNIELIEDRNWAMPYQSLSSTYLTGVSNNLKYSQLNFGDSGGPLLNHKNEIIGINSSFKINDQRSESNILTSSEVTSFFTPLNRSENYQILKQAKDLGSTFIINDD